MKEFNKELSRKYGVKVYNFNNPNFPYFVEGMSEEDGCTEQEIKEFVEYHHKKDELTPWACQIIGWYESVKEDPSRYNELEDIVDEINWYLETMHGLKAMKDYPEWLQEYLYDVDENFAVSYDVWIPIIDRVLPHLS
jgi:hypothetical protein